MVAAFITAVVSFLSLLLPFLRSSLFSSFGFCFLSLTTFNISLASWIRLEKETRVSVDPTDFESEPAYYPHEQPNEDDEAGKIPIKAYFLCTSINLKSMQAEYLSNVIPPSSRSTNYIALNVISLRKIMGYSCSYC